MTSRMQDVLAAKYESSSVYSLAIRCPLDTAVLLRETAARALRLPRRPAAASASIDDLVRTCPDSLDRNGTPRRLVSVYTSSNLPSSRRERPMVIQIALPTLQVWARL